MLDQIIHFTGSAEVCSTSWNVPCLSLNDIPIFVDEYRFFKIRSTDSLSLILHHIIWCWLTPYSYIHMLISFIRISNILMVQFILVTFLFWIPRIDQIWKNKWEQAWATLRIILCLSSLINHQNQYISISLSWLYI